VILEIMEVQFEYFPVILEISKMLFLRFICDPGNIGNGPGTLRCDPGDWELYF